MGEAVNILNGGVETLEEIKASLTELNELKGRSTELELIHQQSTKEMNSKQKAMETEIDKTVSTRKAEVEKSFDIQIDKMKDRIKNARSRRDKQKGMKVSERIKAETADLREQKKDLERELKATFKKDKLPLMFNTSYFYSMFMPEEIGDFCIIVLTIAIMLAIPFGVYTYLPESAKKIWVLVLLYAGVLVLAMGIFIFIFKKIRNKHLSALNEGKMIRDKIVKTKKAIKKQAADIRKDKDESGYGLEDFDSQIAELEDQLKDIISSQKQAIKDFESSAEHDITEEITLRYSEDIEKCRQSAEEAYADQSKTDDRIKALTLDISTKYEAYIGKEMLTIPVIDSLIDIINGQDANNIGGAVALYKKQLADGKKE